MPPNKICWNSFWIMKNTCSKTTVKLVSPKLWKSPSRLKMLVKACLTLRRLSRWDCQHLSSGVGPGRPCIFSDILGIGIRRFKERELLPWHGSAKTQHILCRWTYLFPLVLRRLLPKKQFCTCQLSRCACHASRGCCSSHVDGGHISTAAKPKNKSQKNKKEQHTELLQRGARRKGQTKWIKMVSKTFPVLNHMDPYGYRNWRLAPKSATSGWIQPSFPCSRPNGWSSACHRCPFCSRDSCAPQWQRLVLLQDSHRKNSRKHKVEVSLQEDAWHVQLNSKPFRHLIAFKAPPLTPGAAKHHTPQLPPPDSPLGSKRTLSPLWHGWPKLTQIYILIFCNNFELAADKDRPCRHSLMREPLPALSPGPRWETPNPVVPTAV